EDAAHQELAVVALARHVDGAAEDVAEQQHEHDRLDRGVAQRLGLALHVDEAALGDDPHVVEDPAGLLQVAAGGARGERGGGHAASSSVWSSGGAPVRVRKTSSSVGWRMLRSSTSMPAAFNAAAASSR